MRQPWWAPALRDAARARGIAAEDARPLSDGYHATIALPRVGIAARVGRASEGPEAIQAELDFALLAAGHGLPVLVPADPQGTVTAHGTVSFWPLLTPTGATPGWPWLAQTLARIHQLPVGRYPHRSDPLERIRNRLARYRQWPAARDSAIEAVETACRQLGEELAAMTWPAVIVHGDAHLGNVLVSSTGPLLVDFDLAGTAPAMWDLTIPVVHHRRFGMPGHALPELFAAYGSDPRGQPGFEILVKVQELLCISYVLERLVAGAPAEHELTIRLTTLQVSGERTRWHPLPPADPQTRQQL
jgi:Phosphotransferase enzyme family